MALRVKQLNEWVWRVYDDETEETVFEGSAQDCDAIIMRVEAVIESRRFHEYLNNRTLLPGD